MSVPDTRLKPGGPDAVVMTVCETCNRSDRWTKLKSRHYTTGGLCPGPISQVIYVRAVD